MAQTKTFEELLKTNPNEAFRIGATLSGDELKKYVAPTAPIPPPAPGATNPPSGTGLEFLRYESPFEKETRARLESAEKNKLTPADEQRIREQERAQVQAQIDAINTMFAGEFKKAEREGANRLGSITAIQARGNLMGSDFEVAQREKGVEINADIRRGIETRQNLEIQKLFEKVDDRVTKKVEAENTLRKENATGYLKFLEQQQNEAREDIKTLAAGGISLDKLSKDQFTNLLKDTGYDEFTLRAIHNANKKENKIDYKFELKNGKVFGYGVDPTDGQLKFIEKEAPAGFATATGGKYSEKVTPDGTMLLIPDTIDPNKPIDQQVIMFGKEGQFKDQASNTTTNYKDWVLAGKPGTYAEFLKNKGGTFGDPSEGDKSAAVNFLRSKVGQEVDLGNGVVGVVSEDDVKRLENDPNFFASVLTNAKAAGY